ncbi:MAG TPA: ATP-binding cassette domain-containing protein [Candidatus Acidoferrum sp.]
METAASLAEPWPLKIVLDNVVGTHRLPAWLARFYDPTKGGVSIDGMDLREYKLQSLRQSMAMVLQDTVLFRATMRENIAYGRTNASFGDAVRAAKIANAHDFIEEMPEGYDTLGGRAGFDSIRRPAAADRHRTRHRSQQSDFDSRRTNGLTRRRNRSVCDGSFGAGDEGAHSDYDFSSIKHLARRL